ncbi:MAG: hypothetical protein AMS17_04510 [Spirochaetes bacterium DG_61]|nr:MAG: hypothetical protein AMS17_04510 [Spirochaetes bacterium DG_61]
MKRVVIDKVEPEVEEGIYPIKRVVREKVTVRADVFADGHEEISALLLYRFSEEGEWSEVKMNPLGNDRWEGSFTVEHTGTFFYTIKGWVNSYRTWCLDLGKRLEAGQDVTVDLKIGVNIIKEAKKSASSEDGQTLESIIKAYAKTRDKKEIIPHLLEEKTKALMDKYTDENSVTVYRKELAVLVEREKALFSSWYELFPRSCSSKPGKHGTLRECENLLVEIADMGFDIVYLPPVHPIGKTNRKGKNNNPIAGKDDSGSPWAIGSEEGGHKAVHPQLGTSNDLKHFIRAAKKQGMEVALDLAYQCSPDHPYVKEHPQWFRWRPDNTVQYAENPPKKYEDIIPINFKTDDWEALWDELKGIILFWIEIGVTIFRVDNPHTKPFSFWQWIIDEIKRDYPEVIFLSEAFTRPKVMYRLARLGFSQSYTYFTWRNTKYELVEYLTELTNSEVREYFRPNFWPNTPDILPEYLQFGGKAAFIIRLVLAATLSSNYGIYGPPYEFCVSEALPGKEEYLDSEKYEIKWWDRNRRGNIKEIITRVNKIRRDNPALQATKNLRFYDIENDSLLFYAKMTDDLSNIIFVAVNIDPYHPQAGRVRIPLDELGIEHNQPFLLQDLLSEDKYIWQGEYNYVALNPNVLPAGIYLFRKYLRRENDFDYFM